MYTCNTIYTLYNFVIEQKNRLVGDNIDYEIHARVQSQQHRNRFIHWTHQFVVLDRVQEPQLDRFSSQKPVNEILFAEFLADNDVTSNLFRNWSVIVSRMITKYLQPFRQLRDVVVRHIPLKRDSDSDSVSISLTTVSAVSVGVLTLPNSNLNWIVKNYCICT